MRISLEDVVENMRRDIEIRRIPGSGQASTTIGISFSYPDRFKAQAVTRELVAKLLEGNQLVHRNRELMWRNAWHEAAPRGETVEVLAPANDPREPAPNLLSFAALGLGVGAALGLLAVTALRQPKRAMHLAAFAAGGCALAASASFLLPNRYVSTAVMRFTGPADPIRWYAGRTVEPVAAHVQRIADSVLSRKSLEGIAAKVKLDAGETANLRRGVSIEMLPPALGAGETGSAFRVSSTRGDPRKAQLVVREIVTGFFESYIVEQRSLAKTAGPDFRLMADHKMGENLEVLDPASLYEAPVWPNRFVIAAAGSAAGLLLGAFTFRRRPPGPAIQDAAAAPAI
jgi:hypothetical protein